jgi:uncharacterized protein YdaU (DUF1376 family)
MSKRPWMPLYVGDYLADTGHLTTVQHGAYLLLLMHYWAKGKLPIDNDQLASICRLTTKQWLNIRPAIALLFLDDWRHKRLDEEIEKAANISSARSVAGKKRRGHYRGAESASADRAMTHIEREAIGRLANAEQLPTHSHSHSHKSLASEFASPVNNGESGENPQEETDKEGEKTSKDRELEQANQKLFSVGIVALLDMTGLDENVAHDMVVRWVVASDPLYVLTLIDGVKNMELEPAAVIPLISAQITKYKPVA